MKRLLCLAALTASVAAEPQLFVRNQPFGGPVRWSTTRTLAPLDGLLESLGCSWQVDQGKLQVACKGKGGPSLNQILPISLEGRPLRLEQHIQQDRIFVDVDQVAEALQCTYRRSSDGNTMDLYGPLLSQGLGEGALRGSSEQRDFPIQMQQVQLAPEAGQIRGYVRIKNEGQQAFKWVLVRVAVYEKSGKLLARFSELVRDLNPGQNGFVQFPRLVCDSQQPVTRIEFEAR
ncbi:hypothetical protein IV102_04410 [bacterium]|nr:hypothetical protein [bacterium]